jgi:hypothetical protein
MKGKEKRVTRSIRIEPSRKALIEGKYGTVQAWFDKRSDEEFGGVHEATVVGKRSPRPFTPEEQAELEGRAEAHLGEEITADDF